MGGKLCPVRFAHGGSPAYISAIVVCMAPDFVDKLELGFLRLMLERSASGKRCVSLVSYHVRQLFEAVEPVLDRAFLVHALVHTRPVHDVGGYPLNHVRLDPPQDIVAGLARATTMTSIPSARSRWPGGSPDGPAANARDLGEQFGSSLHGRAAIVLNYVLQGFTASLSQNAAAYNLVRPD